MPPAVLRMLTNGRNVCLRWPTCHGSSRVASDLAGWLKAPGGRAVGHRFTGRHPWTRRAPCYPTVPTAWIDGLAPDGEADRACRPQTLPGRHAGSGGASGTPAGPHPAG